MTSLQSLDLSSNVIGFLKRESLQGLPELSTLKISRNELSRIGEGSFKETPALQHLDVSINRLQTIEQETFKSLQALTSLNLAENQLEDINGLLQTQVGLQWLNVSSNRLAWFDYAFVPPSVQFLDISDNNIDALGNYYNLAENYALRYLDASGNRIAALEPISLLPSMEDVFLEGNAISRITDNAFIGKSLLNQVHLERNQLSTLTMAALMTSPLKGKTNSEKYIYNFLPSA
jgi:Leucine-rich repeat (LRR) protein